jgi:hypothetical protein
MNRYLVKKDLEDLEGKAKRLIEDKGIENKKFRVLVLK